MTSLNKRAKQRWRIKVLKKEKKATVLATVFEEQRGIFNSGSGKRRCTINCLLTTQHILNSVQ